MDMPNNSWLLTNIGELVTMDVPGHEGPIPPSLAGEVDILQDAWLLIRNGWIAAYGTMDEAPKEHPEEIDLEGRTVLPGLVDPHTHLVFAGSREHELVERVQKKRQVSKGQRMSGGINYTVSRTRSASHDALLEETLRRMDRLLEYGTTTAEAKSGYGLDLDNELKLLQVLKAAHQQHPVDLVTTFLGAHAVPPECSHEHYVEAVLAMIPEVTSRGLAEFCDVFCEQGFFTPDDTRRILDRARSHGLKLKVHADELTDTGGAGIAAEFHAVSADHLQFASREGLMAMKSAGTLPVLLPGTAFYLGLPYAPTDLMRELDMPMAISTDLNPGGCYCESQLFMVTLATTQMHLLPIEALLGVTRNAAYAIDRGDRLGLIASGLPADLVVLDAPNHAYIPYHFGVNLVSRVFKNGVPCVTR